MRIVKAECLSAAVARLCIRANRHLPVDVKAALGRSAQQEPWPVAKDVLGKIVENFTLADEAGLPICQDTGMACVFVELGQNVHIEGNLVAAVDEGVRRGYADGYLRKSVVADPLRRTGTGDNTPAMLYVDFVDGDNITITVAPKGFGSENMSRIKMLSPGEGEAGVRAFVLETVRAAGPNPCPPIVVGVGLGGTFDKAALLAKKALLRDVGAQNPDSYYARMEAELLAAINALGIGPQGFGGATTALSVSILAMPTHIAGLPCAVNINCHVARHASEVI